MEISRRTFLQSSIAGGAALSAFGFDVTEVFAQARTLKISRTSETRSTCPYCSVSCGVIIHTLGDRAKNAVPQVVHVEGDPDHPINRGTLCPKGAATFQLTVNPLRETKVKYRAPGSDRWEERPLDWAMDRIAQLVKETREATFVERDDEGDILNHTLAMSHLGGATLDNEENYLIKKLFNNLGIVAIENQARI
jgi:formate dehydrogenase major subunit